MLSKALEEGADVVDVGNGLGVENYDVVQVGGYVVEALDDLVDDLDEPARRGAAALRHDGPLEESGRGAKSGEGGGIFADGYFWWNGDTRSNREKMRPFPKESRTSSTRGMESWPRELRALSFL